MAAKIKLQHILFVGFTLISTIPVIFLAIWVEGSALDKEVNAVAEKHLLVARNLTNALSRYVTDVEAGFLMVTHHLEAGQPGKAVSGLMETLRLKKVWIVDAQGRIQLAANPLGAAPMAAMPQGVFDALEASRELAAGTPGQVVFSDVMANAQGVPTIFLVSTAAKGRFAMAALSTDYLTELQKQIAFGEKGHAAIVDRTGRVLAHPNPVWRAEMRDLSRVKAVAQMKEGKTGVIKFYSPATQSDMIAGYTVLPRVGWGVMIPQPFQELEDKAADVQLIALAITLFGISFAGFLGWMLARYLAGPIQAVVASAREVAAGRLTARAPEFTHFVPYEMRELVGAFNRMVDEVSANSAKLEETAKRLENAQRIAGLGNWEWDIESNQLRYSREITDVFGDFSGGYSNSFEAFQKTLHPDDRDMVAGAFTRALYEREAFDVVHRLVLPDGSERIVHQKAEVHRDEGGKPLLMTGTIHDITEREHAKQLRESEQHFRNLVGQAADAFFLHDADGGILEVNEKACAGLGYAREELVELSLPEIDENMDARGFRKLMDTVAAHKPVTYIGAHCRKDGTCFPVEVQTGFIESGGERKLLSLVRDISERVLLEERLKQSQKLEAMGALAGGIAHDFNNILSPILGFTELVMEKLPKDGQEHSDLQVVYDAAKRARDIVSQILVFSRQSEGNYQDFDPRVNLAETAKFLRSTLPKTITIEETITDEPVQVLGDSTQIHQVLINLTVNAQQAMPEGGTLKLALERVDLQDFNCYLGQKISGPYIRFSVTDSGAGIEPSVMPHLFEPFFTTKPVGQGTGLGLSTVLGIVEQHGGALNVISTPGEGTTFEVYLRARDAEPRQAASEPVARPEGTERILMVDDEVTIVRLGRRVLEEFGYHVTTHTSPLKALEAFRADPAKFHLVITDQMMDGMTGDKLVTEMRNIRHDIPIVLCTGFSESITPEKMRELGLSGFYYKPISAQGLGGVVRRALDESVTHLI